MNPRHLEILQHALGLDKYGQGSFYRNHFVTGPGSDDFEDCRTLTDAGLMESWKVGVAQPEDRVFCVTPLGKEYIAKHSPNPPKLTRSQLRYRRYLNSDTSMTFKEFIKLDSNEIKSHD